MSDQPEFDPRFDPAFQRGFEGAAEEAEPDVAPKLRRNPWVWALWGVAIVFTALGVAGLVPVETSFGWTAYDPGPATVFVLPLLFHGLAPWFLGTGLASLTSVLTISAVRWRPRG